MTKQEHSDIFYNAIEEYQSIIPSDFVPTEELEKNTNVFIVGTTYNKEYDCYDEPSVTAIKKGDPLPIFTPVFPTYEMADDYLDSLYALSGAEGGGDSAEIEWHPYNIDEADADDDEEEWEGVDDDLYDDEDDDIEEDDYCCECNCDDEENYEEFLEIAKEEKLYDIVGFMVIEKDKCMNIINNVHEKIKNIKEKDGLDRLIKDLFKKHGKCNNS